MTPLLKKEIRLLLPAWAMTVLLAAAPTLIFHKYASREVIDNFAPAWLGVVILCAASFGREFSLGTFSSLLAQPCPRKQFWLVKAGVLTASLISVLLVYSALNFSALLETLGWSDAGWLGVLLLTAVAGGLWLALLIRQMIAVVWLIALIPGFLCVPLLLGLSHYNATDRTVQITLATLLLAYSVAGIAGSWLAFYRAQDAGWTSGSLSLPDWMSSGIMQRSGTDERRLLPLRMLIRKEFQFNQTPLLGMAVLFLLHLAGVGLRFLHRNPAPTDTFWHDMNATLEAFGIIWVVAPLIIGCTSIAEERKLGMLENQLCQPASSHRQFLVKFGFIVIIGGLLSSLLAFAAEGAGLAVGADPYQTSGQLAGMMPDVALLMAKGAGVMLAIAILSFFASSLTRNLLQALPAAVGMMAGVTLTLVWLTRISGFHSFPFTRIILWNPVLPGIILTTLLAVILPWLAYRNFRSVHESARIWRRNGVPLALVVAFTMVASAAIYHRAWEKLTPFEPAHGPAVWTKERLPSALRTDIKNDVLIALPDGRLWSGYLANDLTDPDLSQHWYNRWENVPPPALTIGQYLEGSNWVSLAVGYEDEWRPRQNQTETSENTSQYEHFIASRQTVAIRSDGTLWASAKPVKGAWNTNAMVQYGTETNWQEVLNGSLLLKKDGTLWCWERGPFQPSESQSEWPGLFASPPRQIGTDSDWQRLVQLDMAAAQKTDGSIWDVRLNYKTYGHNQVMPSAFNRFLSEAGFNHQPLDDRKLAQGGDEILWAAVRADGTLWIGGMVYWDMAHMRSPMGTRQCDEETNWVAVALNKQMMVALKSDGTLWRWNASLTPVRPGPESKFPAPPTRLGRHNDWVALASTSAGVASLAADGSLWFWRDNSVHDNPQKLVEPSEKPVALGNILAAK